MPPPLMTPGIAMARTLLVHPVERFLSEVLPRHMLCAVSHESNLPRRKPPFLPLVSLLMPMSTDRWFLPSLMLTLLPVILARHVPILQLLFPLLMLMGNVPEVTEPPVRLATLLNRLNSESVEGWMLKIEWQGITSVTPIIFPKDRWVTPQAIGILPDVSTHVYLAFTHILITKPPELSITSTLKRVRSRPQQGQGLPN